MGAFINNMKNGKSENKIKPEVRRQIDALLERDAHFSNVHYFYMAVVSFSIVISCFGLYYGIHYIIDDEVPVVECPASYTLDAPVTLPPISKQSAKQKDSWIKGFMRRYINSSFPRKPEDVVEFLTFVANHSTGAVNVKYKNLLNASDRYKDEVLSRSIRFYPSGNEKFRIRQIKGDSWSVEIDGFLVKQVGDAENREQVVLKYDVEGVVQTAENPEGLVVTYEDRIYTDFVTGNQEADSDRKKKEEE